MCEDLDRPVRGRGRGRAARPVLAAALDADPDQRRGRAAGPRARAEQRAGRDWLGAELGVPARTVSRILRRHGVPYLRECDPMTGEVIRASKATAVRYETGPARRAGPHGRQEARPDPRRWRLARPRPGDATASRGPTRPGSATTTSTPWSTTTPGWPTPRSCPTRRARPAPAFLDPGRGLLRRPRHHPDRAGDDRQRLGLPLLRCARSAPTSAPDRCSSGPTAPGRTARSSASTAPCHRVGLPPGLHQQRRAHRRPCALARALQHSTPPQRTRRHTPDQPTATNVMAGYT